MKKTLLALTALSVFCYSTFAHAYNGIYFTGEGGIATQSGLPSAESVGAESVTTSYRPNAVRLGVGYNHDLTRYFGLGINVGLGWYGKTTYDYYDDTSNDVSSRGLEFLAVGTFHVTRCWDLFAKVGGVRQTMIVTGVNAPSRQTQIRSEAAIGAAYNFTPHFAATITYARLIGQNVDSIANLDNQGPSVNEGLIGLRYTFCS
jgi:OOP family OmpA-OmpF porin